ncbi:UBX domain-containing protein [Cryptosporidium muris RN66]|uniref:UBX domain-containing protein n=1 Tax=Cryptosporidium muris (strain RN66) TaxID=441375 RepID=B6AGH2_CRYMR|nr:UBX domain-containing protein [Cryptosporidium muris RN66]EEA07313.1 UBX domain-containing protein [Cryptosporidium muris RN66]|eukprot:XP_002141662.1 UBX domain-containing protein [Cryptosporidium muris RN66]
MPIIRGLSDLNNEESNRNKDITTSYTGGEKSGIAIENPNEPHNIPPNAHRVILYNNGFILDNGEFRSLDDTKNLEFVRDIKNSIAPEELRGNLVGNQPLQVALDDRSSETYTIPTKPLEIFGGSGSSLSEAKILSSSLNVNPNAVLTTVVDESKPITTLQFRFHNGQRKVFKFNEDQTIADIHNVFMECAPVDGEYYLTFGFPPKKIELNLGTTIKDAGLLQETISQKLI